MKLQILTDSDFKNLQISLESVDLNPQSSDINLREKYSLFTVFHFQI